MSVIVTEHNGITYKTILKDRTPEQAGLGGRCCYVMTIGTGRRFNSGNHTKANYRIGSYRKQCPATATRLIKGKRYCDAHGP